MAPMVTFRNKKKTFAAKRKYKQYIVFARKRESWEG